MSPLTRLRHQQDVERGAPRANRRQRRPVASGTARTGRSRRDPLAVVRGPGRVAGHGGRCRACPSLSRRLFCCHLHSRRKRRVWSGRRRPIRPGRIPRERENDSNHHRGYRRREPRPAAAIKEPAHPYLLARTYIPAHAIPLRTEAERISTPSAQVAVHRSELLSYRFYYSRSPYKYSLYAQPGWFSALEARPAWSAHRSAAAPLGSSAGEPEGSARRRARHEQRQGAGGGLH